MGIFMTGCSDDDYSISNTPLLTDESVTTGSADVTVTSATFHGTVKGLEEQNASAYALGFYYGKSEDNLSEKVAASGSSEFQATVSGMPGDVVYYQAYVTLQGRVTYKGSVQSAIMTDAKAITGEPKDLTANSVILTGKLEKAPQEATSGIVISGVEGSEKVRAGVRIVADGINDNYEIKAEGLLPNTTYHYTAYLDLGNGTVYGEDRTFTTAPADFNPDTDLVDLGLSTKWAKYNVGASDEKQLGGLFGFGDMTGFQTSINLEDYASADIYKTDRDVANKVYGSWVTMPTIDEFEELFTECKKEWVEDTENHVAGYKFTGPNGNSIFLPAAGTRTQGNVSGEGLKIAIDFIDEVISIIRNSKDQATAKVNLMERFGLDDVQAQAIVQMRLGQLTNMERTKIEDEIAALKTKIEEYNAILADEGRQREIIKEELIVIRNKFADPRRTEICAVNGEVDIEDLIPNQECVLTLTQFGYVKRLAVDTYKIQNRGGRGVSGMSRREEDVATEMFVINSHDYVP